LTRQDVSSAVLSGWAFLSRQFAAVGLAAGSRAGPKFSSLWRSPRDLHMFQ
jgi:hypothetical protein